jgi:hypothetical protein
MADERGDHAAARPAGPASQRNIAAGNHAACSHARAEQRGSGGGGVSGGRSSGDGGACAGANGGHGGLLPGLRAPPGARGQRHL